MDLIYIVGQALGIVAIILGFLTYQMKSREQLLFLQISATIVFALHYFLIGAYSGMALNLVGLVRNVTYYCVGKNKAVPKACAILFSILMGVIGALSWQAWYSIFAILGLLINSYCMSFSNPQNIRRSILVTSPMVLFYDCFVMSIGGIIYESVAIVSATIGIIRSRKTA